MGMCLLTRLTSHTSRLHSAFHTETVQSRNDMGNARLPKGQRVHTDPPAWVEQGELGQAQVS